MKIVESLRTLIGHVRNIADEYHQLQNDLSAARKRRAWLDSAPRPKPCITAALDRLIVEHYQDDFDSAVKTIVSQIQLRPSNDLKGFYPGNDFLGRLTTGRSLTFLVSAVLRTEVQRAVQAMQWPAECGPPHAVREAEKRTLDAQISDIESQLAEIRAAADQAGIALGN